MRRLLGPVGYGSRRTRAGRLATAAALWVLTHSFSEQCTGADHPKEGPRRHITRSAVHRDGSFNRGMTHPADYTHAGATASLPMEPSTYL